MPERNVIVFDGVCVLCSGWVSFLLRQDRRGQYRFAAMQSNSGRMLMRQHGLDADDPSSFLLLHEGQAYKNSDAVIRVLRGLGGVWRVAVALQVLPRRMRDAGYFWLARNRYRLFGKRQTCMVPDVRHAERFLS